MAKALQAGMPSAAEQQRIFERDGWHCRCCGVPVVCARARARLSARHAAVRWGKRNAERHAGLFALMAYYSFKYASIAAFGSTHNHRATAATDPNLKSEATATYLARMLRTLAASHFSLSSCLALALS